MPEEKSATPAPAASKNPLMKRTLAIVGIVTLIEGGFFYAATKYLGGGPQIAHGEEGGAHLLDGDPSEGVSETVEIELLKKFRAPNRRSGRPYIFELDVVVKVADHRREEIDALVESKAGEIRDRIARLIRAADPSILHEPELKTLRMQIRRAIGELAQDQDVIAEVLIPRCVPIPQ